MISTTPSRKDTRHKQWSRLLAYLQSQAGADSANDPRDRDTIWHLRQKVNRSLTGT